MTHLRPLASLALLALATAPCGGDGGGDIPRPKTDDLVVRGTVAMAPDPGLGGGKSTPLPGADVVIFVDRNRDGAMAPGEEVRTTTDRDGRYQVQAKVGMGDRAVVSFRYPDAAPVHRTLRAGPKAELELAVVLHELKRLDCEGSECRGDGGKVLVRDLPMGTTGYGKVFNPVTETGAFPGGFREAGGKLLVSGVFGTFEFKDAVGKPMKELAKPVGLKMKIPAETRSLMKDEKPASGKVEVPLYSFNETTGEWVLDGEGILEDDAGNPIKEADLPAVRDGSFAGGVHVAAQIMHFSTWNVDWPIDTHACLQGRVVGPDGKPAEGAVVSAKGLTYTGVTQDITVGADGKFCLDVMRSEAPGEDVDQDGKTGETTQVVLTIIYAGKRYDGGKVDVPVMSGTCEAGGCKDLGDVKLDKASVVSIKGCLIKGRVLDIAGAPFAGAFVFLYDETITPEELEVECGMYYEKCRMFGTSGPDGSFEVQGPVLPGSTVTAWQSTMTMEKTETRFGERSLEGCPAERIDVRFTEGWDSYTLTVTVSGNRVSWTPPQPADYLYIGDSSTTKWALSGEPNPFAPPVDYGVVPPGAMQSTPSPGMAPVPMRSGDSIVLGFSRESGAVTVFGSGETTVP